MNSIFSSTQFACVNINSLDLSGAIKIFDVTDQNEKKNYDEQKMSQSAQMIFRS